ncbi:DUF1365 domain-containing protein [Massilia soli]|uniref:DUF1365 domain-containing protein n=1 Tax=Massilia soli TaxID=2792854 RepID=A0ABS7SSB2_9BURK|nr:DUF1365 domain-containing protein [Massilia soli]MBZ2208843.1 DUF1365 domain-containing protein [Massilia soli]
MRPPDVSAPQLCFGQVRHRRMRPSANAFAYASYYLRLPIRSLGSQGFNAHLVSRNRFNLLSFFDADHGDGQRPLIEWIDTLLEAEGVSDADGEIWLQAMPRVLGYAFNPVSFWFCHRADGALRAVLCDVRNTFGERHFYLLDTGAAIANGSELRARKVFHVSPFCRIEGGYRFRFMRAARGQSEHTLARIDYHDADGLLLETSVSGVAARLCDASVARAFFAFPLMTFGVVARIHWQALRLWLRRVPFYSKPAPPEQKVSR